jgi:regulator of PEP synthase PpsR (kinase-PPPase family)
MKQRAVFFISDRTGITAEMLGRSLLTQFEGIEFEKITLPYIDSQEKAEQAIQRIKHTADYYSSRPLVFSTIIDRRIRELIAQSECFLLDFFDSFIAPLENELQIPSTTVVGRAHGMGPGTSYKARIDAVNFSLNNDDGITTRNYPSADIILVGVSRSGKTPTCLYLALQFGLMAANYPLTEEDLDKLHLPSALQRYRDKLFGLTINPERLHEIRSERRSHSRYASLEQCRFEIRRVEGIYRQEKIPFIDTSNMSIEEIATTILHQAGLERRLNR